jgi:hypothetical protein
LAGEFHTLTLPAEFRSKHCQQSSYLNIASRVQTETLSQEFRPDIAGSRDPRRDIAITLKSRTVKITPCCRLDPLSPRGAVLPRSSHPKTCQARFFYRCFRSSSSWQRKVFSLCILLCKELSKIYKILQSIVKRSSICKPIAGWLTRYSVNYS